VLGAFAIVREDTNPEESSLFADPEMEEVLSKRFANSPIGEVEDAA
jgi:hypothetical protein